MLHVSYSVLVVLSEKGNFHLNVPKLAVLSRAGKNDWVSVEHWYRAHDWPGETNLVILWEVSASQTLISIDWVWFSTLF